MSKLPWLIPFRTYWREYLLLLFSSTTAAALFYFFAWPRFISHNEFVIYPRLEEVVSKYESDKINVLLLGASVLDLTASVLDMTKQNPSFRFHNMAEPGHTSLDSRYKYEYLASQGYTFDYVIFYDAINEVRANSVPPELFKEDYEHYGFYKITKKVFTGNSPLDYFVRRTTFGYSLYYKWVKAIQLDKLVPLEGPRFGERLEWLEYGKDLKSEAEFKKNLMAIIARAKKENATLIVPQFAYHVPDNYTLEGYTNFTLGYAGRWDCCPIEIWGLPENVVNGIKAHNKVIFDLRADFVYLPTDSISSDIANFLDICHFSKAGTEKFVELLNNEMYPSK